MHNADDWAPYTRLDEAAAVYLRDSVTALEALRGVIDFDAVVSFTMERIVNEGDGDGDGESLYQEVVVTDGGRLILWIGDSGTDDEGSPRFTSTVRVIPLSWVYDVALQIDYRTTQDRRELHSVELVIYLGIASETMARTPEKSDVFPEQLKFSKSPTDGGRAQAQRLIQFGKAVGAHV